MKKIPMSRKAKEVVKKVEKKRKKVQHKVSLTVTELAQNQLYLHTRAVEGTLVLKAGGKDVTVQWHVDIPIPSSAVVLAFGEPVNRRFALEVMNFVPEITAALVEKEVQ